VSFAEYITAGWALCAIPGGTKGPTAKGWHTNPVPLDAADGLASAGILHALSGTCALDVDHLELARPWLAERGVDLDALLDADNAVQIVSGRAGRAKLLYRMKRPLRTFRPAGSGLELRCATSEGLSVQDVLPPSIHPDTGKPYEWGGGILSDWRNPPTIPANLLSVWRDLEPEISTAQPASRSVDLVRLRKAAFKHNPDCEYDEWLKVGMQLHDGSDGDAAGFAIWCDWSRKVKRIPYPGDAALKSHWLSFESGAGKHVASGESLVGELPADPEDFEVIDEVISTPDESMSAKRKAAAERVVERFVFLVFNEEYFDTERNALVGDKAIRHMMTPYMPYANKKLKDPTVILMESPKKDIVEALAFHPGEKALFEFNGKRFANTFFAPSIPEPLEPMKDEREKIEWLFNRIDDGEYREWLRQLYAHMIQYPSVKIRTAPLIWSKTEGNGKSTIAHTIPQLLAGFDYYIGVNQSALNSDFNDYLIGKWVVALTEFRGGTRGERASISKKVEEWIADDMLQLTIKNGRGCSVPNHLVVTASTNSDDAAQIDGNNRKWGVHHLNAPPMTETEKAWVFEGFIRTPRARAVLRHYFLNVPITTFSPNADAIRTKDRQEMIDSSIAQDYEMLVTAFEQRSAPLSRDVVITNDVGEYVRKHCTAKPSNKRIGKMLCVEPFNGEAIRFRVGEGVYRGVVLHNKNRWLGAPGKELMAHIEGDDVPLAEVDELLL
jgi:hypothetical protein